MKKMAIFIFLFLSFMVSNVKAYESYKIGDSVTYKDIDYYVIKDSDKNKDYVTLLKKEPLKKDEVDLSSTELKNKINYEKDYLQMAYYSSGNCVSAGNKSGCVVDYKLSDVKQVIDTWVNKNGMLSDLKKDETGYSARLITIDELINDLGYSDNGQGTIMMSENKTPSFLIKNYYYWTMSPKGDSKIEAFEIGFNEVVSTCVGTKGTYVRPVINLKKAKIKNINEKEFQTGDVVYYNNVKFFVIKNSDANSKNVTLLKAEPLTVAEVNKYGKGIINRYTNSDGAVSKDGYGAIAYYSRSDCKYSNEKDISGCSTNYDISDIKRVVDNWGNDFFSSELLSLDDLGYSLRLLTIDDFINNFGYVGKNDSITADSIYEPSNSTPNFVSKIFSCWTMSSDSDNDTSVYYKNTSNYSSEYIKKNYPKLFDDLGSAAVYLPNFSVCPVVTIKKMGVTDNTFQTVNVPDTFLNFKVLTLIGICLILIVPLVVFVIIKTRKS